ncbi:hypothetical protein KK062_25050 [Fulvivirgaceae bacterium PWU5]|uniref:Type IX secretion system membrane protein PorP/SprF n=1 Tax=Dawidia cretensis TaxID=2782350 RepID=A0AAP2E2I9_9BACT|nr:hypothetical protein [Dawidia cretensis]MBT1711535.1 hypothetical protein [Dawidia cretensis]
MNFKIIVVVTLLSSTGVYAQNMFNMSSLHPTDTMRGEAQEQAIRYPSLRQASVTASFFGSGHFDSDLQEEAFASGKSRNVRISSFFAIPITQWNGNAISATIYHNQQFFKVSEVNNPLPGTPLSNGDFNKSTLGLSLNFSRTDAIFHTPVVYSAVFTAISDNLKSVKRFNFNGSIAFPVKHTADVSLSLGVLVQIDPSAPFPVLPIVSYYRRLTNHGLQLILDLPQSVTLKQPVSRKAWIYVGSTANTFTSFYRPNNPLLPERFSYNTIEFKSGPGVEYLFGKYLMLGISGGINTIASATFIAKEAQYHDAFVKNTNKATPYGELRISLLPF